MEKRSGPENWNILSRRHQENNRDPAKEAEGYLVSEKKPGCMWRQEAA